MLFQHVGGRFVGQQIAQSAILVKSRPLTLRFIPYVIRNVKVNLFQCYFAVFFIDGNNYRAFRPRQMGAASTVHDRFQEWQRQGVFKRMWEAGLQAYDETKGIEWTWQAVDGAMTKAPLGGKRNRT